jgi:Zn-dependent protease with chaperone function
MGYLLHLLVALLGQGLAETGWKTGLDAPWLVLLALPIPHLLGWTGHRLFLRGRFRASASVLRVLTGAAPALHVLAVCAFGWLDALERWFGDAVSLAGWPRIGLLLALAPFVVYEAAAIDARARLVAPPGRERDAWRAFHVRMLLSGLVPLAGYVLVSTLAGANDRVRVEIEEVSLFSAAFAAALLLLLAISLPSLLRNVWDTSPFPAGDRRDVLLAVAERARFRARALLAWNTGDLMANAAIVGVGPRTRVVLFSDSLLAQLDATELAAVFAHEIGHAARRHVLIFVSWAGAFFLIADFAANRLFPSNVWLGGGLVLLAVVGWLLGFGFASRRFELEADLYCLDLLGDTSALVRALEKVGGRFRDVASWRHFSTADRVRFLERATVDPAVGTRLRRGLRIWSRAGFLLLAAAAVLQGWALARAFPRERLRADLRLGAYPAAISRASDRPGIDPELARLARRAAMLAPGRTTLRDLEERARAAMLAGDVEAALEWLRLGDLRGSAELAAVGSTLSGLVEQDTAALGELDPRIRSAWNGELEACGLALARRARARP